MIVNPKMIGHKKPISWNSCNTKQISVVHIKLVKFKLLFHVFIVRTPLHRKLQVPWSRQTRQAGRSVRLDHGICKEPDTLVGVEKTNMYDLDPKM